MMPLTKDTPKAMMVHDGSTLIANGIEKLKGFIDNIHITVGYKGATLAKHVIEHNVRTIFNTDGKGNAWWIFNTLLKNVDEPVLVLTCDNVVELDADQLMNDYLEKQNPADNASDLSDPPNRHEAVVWQEKPDAFDGAGAAPQ